MKILASGDWHVGAGAELGRAPGDRLRDQAGVVQRIAEIAVERAVDCVLLAGDLLEGPSALPEQLAVLADFVEACPCPIVAITGNSRHDLAMRETNGLAILDRLPGIRVSSTPEIIDIAGCQVATLPWVHPGRYIAAHGRDVSRDEVNGVVAELLLEAARGLRAQIREDDGPAILLAHWSVSGSNLPNGLPVADLREPVLDGGDLDDLGFDAVVLGHIHAPQYLLGDGTACTVIRSDGETPTSPARKPFYVGSPMSLNFGETSTAHGVWILDLGASSTTFVPVESRQLVTFDLADIEQWTADAQGDPLELAVEEGAIVRVRYTATSDQQRRVDVARMRQTFIDAGASLVRVQPDIVRADRARVEGVDEHLDTLAALELYLEANAIDAALADQMRAKTAEYLEAVA